MTFKFLRIRCETCILLTTLLSVCQNEPTDPLYDDPDSPYTYLRLTPRSSNQRNRASSNLDFFGPLLSLNNRSEPRPRSRFSQLQDDYPPYPGGSSDYAPTIAPVFGLGFGTSSAGWGRKNERIVYLAIPLTALSALLASGQLSNLGLGTTYPPSLPLPASGGYGGASGFANTASYGGASGGYVSGSTTGSNYGPSRYVPNGLNGGGGPSLNSVLFGGGGSYASGGSFTGGSSYGSGGSSHGSGGTYGGGGGGGGGGSSFGSSGSYGGGSSYGSASYEGGGGGGGGSSYSNNYDGDSSSSSSGLGSYSGSSGYSNSDNSGWGGKQSLGGNSRGSGNYGGPINVNIPLPPLRSLGGMESSGSGLPCLRGPGYYRHPIDCNRFYRCVDYQGPPIGNRFKIYEFNCPVGTVYSTQVWVCVWPYQAEAGSCYLGDNGLNLQIPYPPPVPPPILPIIGGGLSGGYGGTYDDEKPSVRGKSMDSEDDSVASRSLQSEASPTTTTTPSSVSSLMQPVSGRPRCHSVGFFVHPFDCAQFAQCWKSSTDEDITGNYFKCPPKTVFNAKVPVCDDPANVPDISASCLQRLRLR